MPAAPAPVAVEEAVAPPRKGRRRLLVLAAAAALAATAGGAAWTVRQRRAAAAAAEEYGDAVEDDAPAARAEPAGPPVFLPLESFVVNLADRESERYAQIGITLELDEPGRTDEMKAYMPAIRNGVLMVLAHKSSQELLTRAGKEKLADEVMRAAVRPLGIELAEAPDATGGEPAPQPGRTPLDESPVRRVHFSSFIIQ